MAITPQDVEALKTYCTRFGLVFVDRDASGLKDDLDWEGAPYAGQWDDGMGISVIVLTDGMTPEPMVSVITHQDNTGDCLTEFTMLQFHQAVELGTKLHLEG